MSEDLYQNIYRVKSTRLSWWDYSSGDYFITICTKKRVHHFWKVIDGEIQLNHYGDIVQQEIVDTMKMRKNIVIDTFIVMPNHIHMIVCIQKSSQSTPCRDALYASPINVQDWTVLYASPINEQDWATCNNNDWKNENNWATCNVALPPRCGGKNRFGPQKNNLASLIRGLKSSIASKVRKICPEFAWQTSFYEHIIRTDRSFQSIREYIEDNPMNREHDRNNIPL